MFTLLASVAKEGEQGMNAMDILKELQAQTVVADMITYNALTGAFDKVTLWMTLHVLDACNATERERTKWRAGLQAARLMARVP